MKCPCTGCLGYADWKAEKNRAEAERLAENTLRFNVWLHERGIIEVGEAMAEVSDTTYTAAVERAWRRERMDAETRLSRMAESRQSA